MALRLVKLINTKSSVTALEEYYADDMILIYNKEYDVIFVLRPYVCFPF